ncbi:TetR/AcrR family transcriptional regulator [Natrialba swarupiae]|nr:TetR/AcrR family transcriptional regulator [Natrialba swarupiae]
MTERTFGLFLSVRIAFIFESTEQSVRMTTFDEPFAEPEASTDEIFRATYLVLRDHGYVGVSIQRIADRTSLSKSTIYYHFDDKYDLLMQFSEELLTWYIDRLLLEREGNARRVSIDCSISSFWARPTTASPSRRCSRQGTSRRSWRCAPRRSGNPEMREYVSRTDEVIRERIATLLEAGIEDGSVRETETEATAAFLFLLRGALILRLCEDDADWLEDARAAMDPYLAGLAPDR